MALFMHIILQVTQKSCILLIMTEHDPTQGRTERPDLPSRPEKRRGFRNPKITKPVAVLALIGTGVLATGIAARVWSNGRLSELRNAEVAATTEAMEGESLPVRQGIEIYLPGTVERETPAMKKAGLLGIISDNVTNRLSGNEALIVYRPLQEELQTGQHGSIDWSQYQRAYSPEDGAEASAETVAEHTYYVNRGAAKEQGRVVVCEVNSDTAAAYLPNGTIMAGSRRVAWGKIDTLEDINFTLNASEAVCDRPLPLQAE